ncbi:hypothetical protein U0Y63_18365 [Enterobacter hormaechei]|uniref:hypothetical protein n=1 Tax=Enterobacter hormaechei TaxID=158836 RepID=UPI0039C46506
MKRLLSIAILAMALLGCGQDTATDKVEKFIKSKDIGLLSKSKISQCSESFVRNFHYFDENTLPTTNKYYELSEYLYGKVKFEPVSESQVGNATEVMLKVSIPKPIEDAKSFIFADENHALSEEISALNNLLALYKRGGLKDMQYTTFDMKWVVLPDGIDPNFTPEQIKACSQK